MSSSSFSSPRVCARTLAVLCVFVLSVSPYASFAGSPAERQRKADEFVVLAQKAELGGDNQQRQKHLSRALQMRPRHALARWLSGHVCVNGDWLPLDEAEQQAAKDDGRNRYKQVRAATFERYLNNLDVHLAMARWCRQNRREVEERYHWYKSLELAPQNPEALAGLNAVWHRGHLVPKDDLKRYLNESRRLAGRLKTWRRRLDEWVRQIKRPKDPEAARVALEQLRAVEDIEAIPALVEVLSRDDGALSRELVAILDRMACPDATLALAWLAASETQEEVRNSATERLRDKPLHDFVPHLLAAMQPVVDSSYEIRVNQAGNVTYEHELSRKTAASEQTMTMGRDFSQVDSLHEAGQIMGSTRRSFGYGPRCVFVVAPRTLPEYTLLRSRNAAQAAGNYQRIARSVEDRLKQTNAAAEKVNERICAVLASVTDKDLGEDLVAWWSWWDDYNELQSLGQPTLEEGNCMQQDVYIIPPKVIPVVDREYPLRGVVGEISDIKMDRTPIPNSQAFGKGGYSTDPRISIKVSCFVRGTLVKTREGSTPIEQIQAGDLVLAQNVDTGELDYRPVLTTTVRPPSSLRRIRLPEATITATAGHPFWVTGEGWRMAKFLKPGDRIHGIDGSTVIDAIDSPPDEEAINLIVGDFHTYFVGEKTLLAHDGLLRQPTVAVLPGYQP
jgi:hypothetical protein